jgi:RNA polymerase sigma-70 factor (ECF subfamily)
MPNARATRLEALFHANTAYISSIAWSILGNRADVQDLVQDAFVIAHRALHDLEEPAAVRRWFAVTAVRLARRRHLRQQLLRFDDVELRSTAAGAEERLLLREVALALDRVPARARTAWSLRIVDELDLQTVAERCGCSLATTKRLLRAAKTAIAEEVGDA